MYILLSLALPQPRVNRVPDAFTKEIIPYHGYKDGKAGEDRKPPGDLDVVLACRKQAAPARGRRLDAEA